MSNDMSNGKYIKNCDIYDELTDVKIVVAKMGENIKINSENISEIKNNHLVHIQKDLKDLLIKVTALDKNQAVLMTKMALVFTAIIATVEIALRYFFNV